jgi:hypothetical protein
MPLMGVPEFNFIMNRDVIRMLFVCGAICGGAACGIGPGGMVNRGRNGVQWRVGVGVVEVARVSRGAIINQTST